MSHFILKIPNTTIRDWGISTAAATVFFAFIGFDALAANSAETKDPEKTLLKESWGQ